MKPMIRWCVMIPTSAYPLVRYWDEDQKKHIATRSGGGDFFTTRRDAIELRVLAKTQSWKWLKGARVVKVVIAEVSR